LDKKKSIPHIWYLTENKWLARRFKKIFTDRGSLVVPQ
jgi:hypothetical protein